MLAAYLSRLLCTTVARFPLRRELRDRSGSSKASKAIKIRFSSTAKRMNEAFLPRAEHRILSLCLFFLTMSPSRWLDAAANKKGRKIIEKVEQPRSLACTCREACRLYRHARPRDGHEHFDMLWQGIYLYLS